jgi:2'-5' RNA ligase
MSDETKPEPTDDEIVEKEAQQQFGLIMQQKRRHDLQGRIEARIHELAQAADLKPQSEDQVLEHMTLQRVEQMRKAHLERIAEKSAEKAFGAWLNDTGKKIKLALVKV